MMQNAGPSSCNQRDPVVLVVQLPARQTSDAVVGWAMHKDSIQPRQEWELWETYPQQSKHSSAAMCNASEMCAYFGGGLGGGEGGLQQG